jgi:hypothetical protein
MTRWQDVVEAEPDLAAEVLTIFDAHKHKTIATLRKDGSPRLSGIEVDFLGGEATFGMMPASKKAADLRRDPRTEIHSASVIEEGEEQSWAGDARISGRAWEVTDPEERKQYTDAPPEAHPLFALDIERVVRIKLDGSPPHLLVQTWRPGEGVEQEFVD